MSNEYEQPVEPMSRTEDLLRTGTEEPVIAMSEIEKILRGEHIDRPHSRVADLLLQYNPSDILIEKRIEENGTYYATADAADGYYKVVVDTPVIPPTVLEHLVETVSTNGTHTFTPGTGVDGFSDATISVNVPANVTSRSLTVNGTFSSAVDNKDGYSSVTVNVQEAPVKTTSLSVTENGTYVPGPASEVSLTIPTIPDEVETDVSAGAAITNFDNLRIEFTNKTTSATGHVDIYPSAIATQQIPMSFKNRTLIMGPDGDHYITIVNGYDSIVVLQKGYTITAMKLTSYSGYFDEVSVDVTPNIGSKSITQNGNYAAASDNLDGYSNVSVNVVPNVGSKNITENGTYNASSDSLDGYSSVVVDVDEIAPQNSYGVKQLTGLPTDIATFNDGEALPLSNLKVGIEPQQEGSGDPSPTNIRPISGWSEANVGVVGKNLLNESALSNNKLIDGNGNVNDSGVTKCTEFYIKIKGPDTITVSYDYESLAYFNNRYYAFYDANKNFLSSSNYVPTNKVNQISIPNNAVYIRISFDMNVTNIMIELGTTATTYEPYNGATYTIDLDGTRYGGEVDVVSGVLTLTHGIVDLGSLTWVKGNMNTANTGRIFYSVLSASSPMKQPSDNGFCEALKYNPFSNWSAGQWERQILNGITVTNTAALVACVPDNYSSASDFKTAMNGVQLVYELATPLTIQLTPTAVKSLRGVNNLSADCGQVRELSYLAHVITNLEAINITSNGDYTPQLTKGYSQVTVNLPDGTNTEY